MLQLINRFVFSYFDLSRDSLSSNQQHIVVIEGGAMLSTTFKGLQEGVIVSILMIERNRLELHCTNPNSTVVECAF